MSIFAQNIVIMNNIKINRGLNIKLKGVAEKTLSDAGTSTQYAVKPPDFAGLIPKLAVKAGHEVKAGSVLFFDKSNPEIKFTSPISGTIASIERGARRKILAVVIENNNKQEYEAFKIGDPSNMSREDIVENLLNSGVWPFIKQRPYGTIAKPDVTPKSIFISAFDSAPLGVDYNFVLKDEGDMFQKGIDVLKQLTSGNVHLGVDGSEALISAFKSLKNVEITSYTGKHPAGLVGTHINKIDPLNKGEKVWQINPQDVLMIGRLFAEGKFDARRKVALVGSEVEKPQYYNSMLGAQISSLANGQIKNENVRYISGNVLTGSKESLDGFVGFFDSMVSVIPEGNHHQFFGWIAPNFHKYSMSKTYFSWLMPNKSYALDTNFNGGHRAFVVTGQYEKVVPLDIYPVELLKACIIEDIDKMEQLGIYEVLEEDFALCDYVCTSKQETQDILRQGLDLMIKEVG
jgi:Na+-transporting NADH:ubiquinone oxidoreductase subunit A